MKQFSVLVALGCALASASIGLPSSASAASYPFDGSWNLQFVTRSGDCDSYNFMIDISRGIITHPNLVRFRGRVNRNGAAQASVRVGDRFASGAGRLSRVSGGGYWAGYSGSSRCSGSWSASRN